MTHIMRKKTQAMQNRTQTMRIKRQSFKIEHKQDKVNYAVSEKEDGVTGVQMLMRMMGCTGVYWSATELYWVVLDSSGL